jgi:hypothetical protein
MMKLGLLMMILLLTGLHTPNEQKEIWVIQKNSYLIVAGKTNINSFDCAIENYGKTDTLTWTNTKEKSAKPGARIIGRLTIPVLKFDCGNKMMTKDLQKTLKAPQYPVMTVDFLSFSKNLSKLKPEELFTGQAEIKLAGVSKRYTITYVFKKNKNGLSELTGNQAILFSDFNLIPPSKLGGTIKVDNELKVSFTLILQKN